MPGNLLTRFVWQNSLKTRVTATTLLTFLLGIWALSFYASHTLRSDMEQLLGDQQLSAAAFAASAVDDDLRARIAALQLVAKAIDQSLIDQPAKLQTFLENRFVLHSHFNAGLLVVDHRGKAIADVPLSNARTGKNYIDIDTVAAALIEGKSTVGQPMIGKALGVPVFGISAPIYDTKGQIIGALAGVTNLSKPNFLDKVTQNSYGRTGGYVVVSRETRTVVTATDKNRMMERLPTQGVLPAVDRYMAGYEGSMVTLNPKGINVLVSVKAIKAANWYLGVQLPTEEAFELIDAMQKRLLLFTLALTVLASAVVWYMLRHQLSPLFDAVKKLAAMNDKTQPLQALPVANNEIGELTVAFNRLLETLMMSESDLKASESRLLSILDASPVAMGWHDANQKIRYLNTAFLNDFGYSASELPTLEDWWLKAYPDPDYRQWVATTWQTKIDEANAAGRPAEPMEAKICCKNGEIKTVLGTVAAIQFGSETIYLAVLNDISERTVMENELKRSNAELEQFSYAISHDMRQPLRMVTSYLQLLESELAKNLSAEQVEYLNFAVDGAKRMDMMLLALLEYSRVGRRGSPPGSINSRAVLDEALLFLRPAMAATDASLVVNGEWPLLWGIQDELVRLLQNLIGNALKFHLPECRPEIRVNGEIRDQEWLLTVADKGVGILPDQIGRLFQMFQRLQSRAHFEGSGIGLALCRKIVEHQGGRIWVESPGEGLGCIFHVALPLDKGSPHA